MQCFQKSSPVVSEGPLHSSETRLTGKPKIMQKIYIKGRAGWLKHAMLAAIPVFQALMASANTLYVWQGSPHSAPPFATWSNAATNIQEAIDAASAGDEIVVTNGVYARGVGAGGSLVARVALNKPVTVRSVNGPGVTIIRGERSIPSGVGPGALRCAYVANGAVLSGFALTNGATFVFPSSAYGRGGGAYCEPEGVLSNCVLTANVASEAGGLFGGRAQSCQIEGNIALYGFGGGAAQSTLSDCILSSNLVYGQDDSCEGGGAYDCTLDRCIISGNYSINDDEFLAIGAGVSRSRLVNCLVKDNRLLGRGIGGGAYASSLTNCTVVSNTSGAIDGTVINCIVYANEGWNVSDVGLIEFTCTTPLPANGTGNITNQPAFVNAAAGDYHLRPESPCIDSGTGFYVGYQFQPYLVDLDGNPRPLVGREGAVFARYDMGAYEYLPPPVATDRIQFLFKGSWQSTNTFATAVRVVGDHAYLASRRPGLPGGLQILDIRDPAHPVRVGGIDTGGSACDVEIVGNHAYVADAFFGGLRIIDVSDPAHPVTVGSLNTHGCAESSHALRVIGSLAYLADGIGAVQVIDVSNPAVPYRLATLPIDGSAHGVEVIGNRLYVVGLKLDRDDHLGFLEVFSGVPTNMMSLGRRSDFPGSLYGVAVGGSSAYVVGEERAFTTVDLSDLGDLDAVGQYHALGWAQAVQLEGNYAYIAGEYLGLAALDISNPAANPVPVGRFPFGVGEDEGWDVHVVGNHAYLARGGHGLLVFEITGLPVITSVARDGNAITISWNAAPGIRLQRATSLTDANWVDVPDTVGNNNAHLPITTAHEFFKLVRQ